MFGGRRKLEVGKSHVTFNLKMTTNDVICVANPLDFFALQKHVETDKQESVSLTNDIFLMFHQQNIDRSQIDELAKRMNSQVQQSFDGLRAKIGDTQLLQFIKDRNIQSPTEIMNYQEYLSNRFTDINGELKGFFDALKKQKDDKEKNTTPKVEPISAPNQTASK